MDKPRHPQVIRTWKVERIRKLATPKEAAAGETGEKVYVPNARYPKAGYRRTGFMETVGWL